MANAFGFVTIALGSKAYLDMAIDMVLSLREFHDDPVCLLTDTNLAATARSEHGGVFEIIETLPEDLGAVLTSKFHLARLVPFETAFFIDADVLVLAALDREITATHETEICLMGSFVLRGSRQRHHDVAIDDLIAAFDLERYFTNHNGAFGYQRDFARMFFDECAQVDQTLRSPEWRKKKGFIGSELAMGVVNGRRGLPPMSHRFPVIWPEEMADMRPGYTEKPLLHFIDMPPVLVFRDLMSGVDARRHARGLPCDSGPAWLRKGMKSRRTRLPLVGRVWNRLGEVWHRRIV